MGADTLWQQLSASPVVSGSSPEFDTTWADSAALDINVTAITGGVTPSITFRLMRQGADGAWYLAFSTAALTATGPVSVDLSPGLASAAGSATVAQTAPVVFTRRGRVDWVFGGATPPTSVAFSASLIGRGTK